MNEWVRIGTCGWIVELWFINNERFVVVIFREKKIFKYKMIMRVFD